MESEWLTNKIVFIQSPALFSMMMMMMSIVVDGWNKHLKKHQSFESNRMKIKNLKSNRRATEKKRRNIE